MCFFLLWAPGSSESNLQLNFCSCIKPHSLHNNLLTLSLILLQRHVSPFLIFLFCFCVHILLSFLNPFVNWGTDWDKITLLSVLCLLLVPPNPLVTRCPGYPPLHKQSRNQMLVFWLQTQTMYWARTPKETNWHSSSPQALPGWSSP